MEFYGSAVAPRPAAVLAAPAGNARLAGYGATERAARRAEEG